MGGRRRTGSTRGEPSARKKQRHMRGVVRIPSRFPSILVGDDQSREDNPGGEERRRRAMRRIGLTHGIQGEQLQGKGLL